MHIYIYIIIYPLMFGAPLLWGELTPTAVDMCLGKSLLSALGWPSFAQRGNLQ